MDVLTLGAAISVVVTIMAFAMAFASSSNAQIRGRLEGVLSGASVIETATASAALRQTPTPAGFLKFFLSGAWLIKMERELRLAESRLQPVDFIAIRVALAGLAFSAPFIFLSGPIGTLFAAILGLVAAIVGFMLPQFWLNWRKEGRRKRLEEQLPDALIFVSNSLKAGFGLLQSLSMAADQLENPIAKELEQTVYETNVGSSMDEAFLALSERCDSYDLDLVVTAVLIQRSAGGNLSEILENVASTMRERVRIRGEIQTLTAQQRLTGMVIAGLPVAVGGMFFIVSPDYITTLFTDTMGQVALGMAAILETIGIVVIRRILAIEV
jgi:tight adherence protein B